MDLEKVLLRKVGEAVGRFKMIRDGDRVAVALSGGKDSLTLLEALLLLRERAPIHFYSLRFHRRAGQVSAANRTPWGVSQIPWRGLDVSHR